MKKTMAMIGLLSLSALLLLASCTTRNETRIAEAQARTDTARYDYLSAEAKAQAAALTAQAQAQAAEAKAQASIGVAQANSQTAIVREQEKTTRETAWLQVLPFLLLIVVGAGAVYIVLYYRGKAHLIQVQAATMLPPPQQWLALPPPRVQRAALEYNAVPVPDSDIPGAWLLLLGDGQRMRMLPPPKR